MKRLLSLLFTALVAVTASAQLPDGYYRLQCKETGRYIAIHNKYVNTASAKGSGQLDLQSLETIVGFDNVVNDPGSVIYIRNTSNGVTIEAQGFTTANQKLKLNLIPVGDAYRLEGRIVYEGQEYVSHLRDYGKDGKSYVTTDPNKSTSQNWYIKPISDENYFGLKGDTKVGNSYYTTIFATFPFQLGSGMKAYAVNTLTNNSCTLQDIGNVVPKLTPVVIACAGEAASANKVTLISENNTSVIDNKLAGVIFCYPVLTPTGEERRSNPAWNCVDHNPEIMRVIGEADGKLAFITAGSDLKYMPANKAFLSVAAGSAAIIPTDGSTTGIKGIQASQSSTSRSSSGTYTLNGVRVPDNVTPQKGIYIENGKKVVKK